MSHDAMIFYLRPTIAYPYPVEVIDVVIDPFGVRLLGGVDVVFGRPYINKQLKVVYRKGSRRHLNGIVLLTPPGTTKLTLTTRWTVATELLVRRQELVVMHQELLVTHQVDYSLREQEFDLASDDVEHWAVTIPTKTGILKARITPDLIPTDGAPYVCPEPGKDDIARVVDQDGWTLFLHQALAMPTMERERLWDGRNNRMPPLESAFDVRDAHRWARRLTKATT